MADLKISQLTASTTPLAGTEVLPVVQSGTTKQVSVANLTAGRAVTASKFTAVNNQDTLVAQSANNGGSTLLSYKDVAGTTLWDVGIGAYIEQDELAFRRLGSTVFYLDKTSNARIISGNLVIGTSGNGIDFSATPGTGTSELFDDYEEGTWTPTFVPTSGAFDAITYVSTGGYYTKVGRLVTVTGRLRTNGITVGTASGSLFIGGLPFTSQSTTAAAQGGNLTVADPGGWTVNNPSCGFVNNGDTKILLQYRTTANGAASDSNVTDLGTVGLANNLSFSAYYFTS
jgi:hypothetical protein